MTEESQEMSRNTLGALVGLTVGFVLGLIVAWIYWVQREEDEPLPTKTAEERLTLEPGPAPLEGEVVVEVMPDDLTRVEGIGPKMSSVLRDAGIMSFGQLAESEPGTLRDILREEGLQFADPSTWPEQAALAAIGDWGALEDLQDELSGGRRVE